MKKLQPKKKKLNKKEHVQNIKKITLNIFKNEQKKKEEIKEEKNNLTTQSLQSTMKESSYYKKEMEKISDYIKRCKITL